MFEQFTEEAQTVISVALQEAHGLKHNYIGTEHILLGLLGEELGIARQALEALHVSGDNARARIVSNVGPRDVVPHGEVPFSPHAEKALELSSREARRLGDDFIGTEHILLGLLDEQQGEASRVLLECGAAADAIREEVARALPGRTPEQRRAATEGLR